MAFITGFAIWLVFGIIAGAVVKVGYKAPETNGALTIIFAIFGAFIGGMLGTSPYIHHDPTPLRVGALIGAVTGAFFFSWCYHFVARRAI